MNVLELSEQEIGRRESLQELRNMGINPYPAAEYATNAFSTDIRENVENGQWIIDVPEGEEPKPVNELPQVCIAPGLHCRKNDESPRNG